MAIPYKPFGDGGVASYGPTSTTASSHPSSQPTPAAASSGPSSSPPAAAPTSVPPGQPPLNGTTPFPPLGPPYPPMFATLGGLPTPIPDVPLSAVFLVLFLLAGLAHMKIFRSNKAKSHKFVFSAAIFAFCMIRVISTSLRMGWSYHETNLKLGIAAQIFTQAGIVILYIVNLFFTQRLLNARHPGSAFRILVLRPGVVVTILSIIMVIIVTVQSFYTLNVNTHRIDRDIQLYALTFFTVVAFIPFLTVILMLLVPRNGHIVKVPSGTFRTNAIIVLFSSALLTLGAGWKAGTNYRDQVLLPASPWYFSKAYFWTFQYMFEFLVVLIFLLARVDRRFYVPPKGEEMAGSRPISTVLAAANNPPAPTGFSSPHDSEYSDASERTTYEERLPLFLQVVLEVDPDTGKYRVGHDPVLQEMNRGKSKASEKDKE